MYIYTFFFIDIQISSQYMHTHANVTMKSIYIHELAAKTRKSDVTIFVKQQSQKSTSKQRCTFLADFESVSANSHKEDLSAEKKTRRRSFSTVQTASGFQSKRRPDD